MDDADTCAAFPLPRPNRTLTALATSALALPGIAGSARADAPIERASASTAFSYYREDNIRGKRLAAGGMMRQFARTPMYDWMLYMGSSRPVRNLLTWMLAGA